MADLNWDDDVDADGSLPKYFVNDSGGSSVIMYHSGEHNGAPLPLSTFSPLFKAALDYSSVERGGEEEGMLMPGAISENESISNSTILEIMNGTTNLTRNGARDELYDVPVSIIILLSLLYGGISLISLIGNMLVLWVVTVSRRMRTVTNMFIANLALADIIIGLFTIPFQFQAALLQRWNLPDFMCAFCPFVQILSVNVSVFTLSAIAVDRYRAVLFPLSARSSKRKATWAILSIWSLGLVIALPTEVDYKVIEIMDPKLGTKPFCTNLGLSPTFRMYYTLGLVVIQYFFPLIIISAAYTHMATKLWGTTAPGNKEESRDAVVLRNKKKVIKMLALVVLLFALCWAPLQTYYFLSTLIPSINQYQYINIIWFCFHWLAMSNSCCNPFIYAIYNDKFQREFRARLWCFRICHKRNRHDDNGYSEASDFDRSKVRASYRFTNSRSVRYNQHSIYGGGRSGHRSNGKPDGNINGRRNSSYHSRRSLQHRPADRTDSGESGHHPHPHYHRYLDVGPNYSGSGGTGDSQSNLSINSPPPSPVAIDATIAISELEAAATTLRNGGIGEAPYLNGGSTISRSNSQEPPKSQTAVLSTSYCGPLVSLANNNVKTVTVVATETTCKL